MMQHTPFIAVPVLAALCLSGLGAASHAQQGGSEQAAGTNEMTARALIRGCSNPSTIGLAFLREAASTEAVKEVDVVIKIWPNGILPLGKHAVHIHQTSECQPCSAAGGHFDPGPYSNTSPDGNHPFHAGDLVNIEIDEAGQGTLFAATTRVTLSDGPLSLFDDDGSAFIIHVDPDSYCPDGASAGCAGGARAACGLILRD